MSLYDNFRAPQYVDFAVIHSNDCDTSSSFFDRDSDMDQACSDVVSKLDASSISSFNGTIIENDVTLTPSGFNNTVNEFGSNPPSNQENEVLNDSMSFEAFNVSTQRVSTPMVVVSDQQGAVQNLSFSFSVQKENKLSGNSTSAKVSSLNAKTPQPISVDSSGIKTVALRKSRCSNGTQPLYKRRSKSASSSSKTLDCEEDILNDALQTLSLKSGSHQKNPLGVANNDLYSSPIQLVPNGSELSSGKPQSKVRQSSIPMPLVVPDLPSLDEFPNAEVQSKVKDVGPKRKLSPPPKNLRDYSQQPAKYMSMAEQIALVQKQTPKRFRTLPSAAGLKKSIQSKVARNLSTQTNKSARSVSNPLSTQRNMKVEGEGSNDHKGGVRVARWPRPEVPRFAETQYVGEELPKTVFNFEQKDSVILRDRRTPLRRVRQVTKVKPFSFDKRDQELVQRKINRIKGVEISNHCCARKPRQRSLSQGDEDGRKVLRDPLVHHARVPTVLHKPPFVPQKKPRKQIRPIDCQLHTEKRAKQREEFDEHVKQKEMDYQYLRSKQQEEKQRQEQLEILKLRKEVVHKARPVPEFRPFVVHSSDAPLTEPCSPNVARRTKSARGPKRMEC